MKIKKNVSLKDKNEFKTGGNAKFYCEPENKNDFFKVLSYAKEKNLNVELLGGGANILISDDGFDGLIIKPIFEKISYDKKNNFVTVGAGKTIQNCIDWCIDNNLLGLEEFSGIPGTIGGATYMNIHYFNFFFSDFFVRGTVINRKNLKIEEKNAEWFEFGYDKSRLQGKDFYIIDATLKLRKSNNLESAYARGRRDEIIRHRNSRYPTKNTCGSFFKNFCEKDMGRCVEKITSVAYYLDQLGIKGKLSCGDAIVSPRHANMIENKGNATSNDIIAVAKKMQKMVFENFELVAQPECQFIGFDDPPFAPSDSERIVSRGPKSRRVKSFLCNRP
jgi:UDP-N-acetylmuramate dehydrogenase